MAADEANHLRQQSEQEKAALREQLRQQLNLILETRNTARGLIVNMSDVLFDTAKYTLRPGAREKLAKISGILLAHPGLKVEVEGHTDSVGGEEYNQRLSEQRAASAEQRAAKATQQAEQTRREADSHAKQLVANARLAGATPLWEWVGEGATVFSY